MGIAVGLPYPEEVTGFYHLMEFEADASVILPSRLNSVGTNASSASSPRRWTSTTSRTPKPVATSLTANQQPLQKQKATRGLISPVMADKKVRYLNPIDIETKAERSAAFARRASST